MDVYGYQHGSWQCNNSEELNKHIYTQQALSNLGQFSCSRVDPHVMPVPSGQPWNMQTMSWSMPSPQPQLVQFTAHQVTPNTNQITPVIHCKRKPVDVDQVIPAKQLITEEKMAAHLSGLHISSSYTSHCSQFEDPMEILPSTSESSSDMGEWLKGHKIVLSDEIKNLKNEPLLPAALIERLEKPCMSLMVWKPKEEILDDNKKEDKERNPSEETISKRNGVLVDNTYMDVEM